MTATDWLRMFKPANPSASWYAVARMEIRKEKQKVGTKIPASPVVCPVQMGPDDDGSYVEAWGLEGSGAAMNEATHHAMELLAGALGRARI